MKTTIAQMEEYLTDCKGYDTQEIEEVKEEWGNDLDGYLRSCGADDTAIEDVKGFFK